MAGDSSQRLASLGGITTKQLTLLILTLQNTAHVLILHYSRVMPVISPRYFISTAVLLGEVVKLTLSLTVALFHIASNPQHTDTSTATALFSELSRAVFNGDSWKLAIPAVLYTLQNGLQYIALSNLDASTFQITNQLKIFVTAIFSMLFLGRTIDARRWSALGALVFGVVVVALSAGSAESPVLSIKDLKGGAAYHEARNVWDLENAGQNAAKRLAKRSATYEGIEDDFAATNPHLNPTLGLLATAVSCVISGFVGTVSERIVKEPKNDRSASIWVRNIQLSLYSLLAALAGGVLFMDGSEIAEHGFFAGYNWAVWLVIVLQAVGGLAVGLLVKVDNCLSKGISGGISIALTFLLSMVFLDLEVNSYYFFGAAVTMSSLYVLNLSSEEPKHPPRPPQIRIPSGSDSEKQGYFDLESNITPAKSPLRADQLSLSTSRPGTPTYERRTVSKSSENLLSQLEFISRGVLVAIAQVEGASLTAAFANADALSRASAFSSLASPHLTPPHFLVLIPCENYEDTGRLTMTQRLFEQLDRLERGARVEDHPPREAYNESSADYSAYEGNRLHGEPQAGYYGHYEPVHEPYVEEPLTFDAFDEQLLRQPDYHSRQDRAARGRARVTLPPASRYQDHAPYGDDTRGFASQRPSLSQFAYEQPLRDRTSSSLFDQPLRSSPAFHANQRRPAPLNLDYNEDSSARGDPPAAATEQPTRFERITAHEIDAEIETYGNENADPLPPPPGRGRPPPTKSISTRTSIGPPVVHGIHLVPTDTLPDRFRALFPYPLFNAVQSKSFNTLYKTSDNFVLAAPTGSGKTVALELAICRLINGFSIGSYKIVYQAPTKSLCSERYRDWQAKFGPLDLQCAELTGDTDNISQRNVQNATIIITTPEKWDSVTRKWKDQQKLMRMVKLFLIDEVHILKEERGATLEAVVSRMKSVGSDVRFIALSATVPNSEDIATWLGKDPMNSDLPAPRERFGEEFRPVKLDKHVAGYRFNANDFAFDKHLNEKLPEVIAKYSQRKPIMVFCFTRPACVETAKVLSNWWASKSPAQRYWSQPRQRVIVADKDLADTVSSGVAFHHAGLTPEDRSAVEKGYLNGDINVICCTSTLAVGVNLPCHMVIIKNTVSYQSTGCKEYSDLETMQMLGRAGRPQFDDTAVAVIMTKMHRVQYYENMITGQEFLESCLHRNLIDHLNAEIGLGTITNASSAKKWLSGTFLYVRLKEHPEHYKLDGDSTLRNVDERLENICAKGIALLEANDLVSKVPKLHCTEFGDAMARYYLQFDTMKVFRALPPKAKVSEILSALSQASEFKDVRFRAGEKPVYKDLNKNSSIKFPLPGALDSPAQKISLIIQSVLGAIDLPSEDYKIRQDYTTSKSIIFNNVSRLIRCVIDCQLYLEDAVTARNALALARSLGAQVWDDSPLHIKQLDGIGIVFVRKLVGAGIKSLDDLENTEPHRIEKALSRNPPFGTQLIEKAKAFPRLRVSIKMVAEPSIKKGEHVTIKLKAEIGFLNDKAPMMFQRKAIYVCLLAETSDGRMIHFVRVGAKKLDKGLDVLFSANLSSATQSVRAYVMCDEIAGTARHANLNPEIPANAFPPPKTAEEMKQQQGMVVHAPNTAKRRTSGGKDDESDEFGDAGLDDADLAQAEADVFVDIDDFDDNRKRTSEPPKKKQRIPVSKPAEIDWQPTQFPNGKWACNHPCRDKTQCKHLCCREGLDKKPKPPKTAVPKDAMQSSVDPRQTQLGVSVTKKSAAPTATAVVKTIEQPATTKARKKTEAPEVRDLDRLHNSVKSNTATVPILGRDSAGQASCKGLQSLSFPTPAAPAKHDGGSSDYGADPFESTDLPSMRDLASTQPASRMSPPRDLWGLSNEDDEMLDTGFGVEAGDELSQPFGQGNVDGHVDLSSYSNKDALEERDRPYNEQDVSSEETSARRGIETAARAANKDSHLFVGYSTDSAANDLGLAQLQPQKRPTADQTPATKASKFLPPIQTSPKRTTSAQLREEEARFLQALPPDEFIASVHDELDKVGKDVAEAEPSSPDSLKRWVMEEFGAEHFNITW